KSHGGAEGFARRNRFASGAGAAVQRRGTNCRGAESSEYHFGTRNRRGERRVLFLDAAGQWVGPFEGWAGPAGQSSPLPAENCGGGLSRAPARGAASRSETK